MRKTLKRQALESIVRCMKEVESSYLCRLEDDAQCNSGAIRDLAEAYTLVKRGVMLPDYGREKDE